MRVAYFVTSYRPPAQLVRLLGTLRRGQPDSPLVVHRDRFRAAWDDDLVAPVGGVHVLTSDFPVSWGDFSIVDMTWRSLAWMVEHTEFDWVVFLSEQDYPVAPPGALEQYLQASGADAFSAARRIDAIADPDLRLDCDRRYNYRYRRLPRLGLMARLAPSLRRRVADPANYVNYGLYRLQKKVTLYRYPDPHPMRLGIRPRRSPYTAAFPCWYASQWMALSRRAAEAVVAFVGQRADYVAHVARTVIPDESATATIVCNDPALRVELEDLHRVRFSTGDGHPDVFRLPDVAYLLDSGRFFARKFDVEVDSAVLDALDRRLFSTGSG